MAASDTFSKLYNNRACAFSALIDDILIRPVISTIQLLLMKTAFDQILIAFFYCLGNPLVLIGVAICRSPISWQRLIQGRVLAVYYVVRSKKLILSGWRPMGIACILSCNIATPETGSGWTAARRLQQFTSWLEDYGRARRVLNKSAIANIYWWASRG